MESIWRAASPTGQEPAEAAPQTAPEPAAPRPWPDPHCVAAVPARAIKTEAALAGKPATQSSFDAAAAVDGDTPGGPALRLGRARIPINRDLLFLNGREHRLGGVVVHIAETGKTYLPRLPPPLLAEALAND